MRSDMAAVSVVYAGAHAEVWAHGVGVVKRGVPVVVEADIAGRAPGAWRPVTDDAPAPEGWPVRDLDDGTQETRDPGTGLLAQPENWQASDATQKGDR